MPTTFDRRTFLAATALSLPRLPAASALVETHVAIQGVCAWPKLIRLDDGTILAFIFNQPCHGHWEGDLDCWESRDDGMRWRFRSRVAPHEPTTVRMNCAAGRTPSGDLIVVCGGWSDKGPPGSARKPGSHTIRPWVCRSSDQGKSWNIIREFPDPPQTETGRGEQYYPFGKIEIAADGSLCVAVYVARGNNREAYLLRSRDQGATWPDRAPLNVPGGNETWILHTGSGNWLAAGRRLDKNISGHFMELLTSIDDARTWRRGSPLTLPRQINGSLLRLRTGRILFTFGNRCWSNYGIDARLSDDNGVNWSPPFRVAGCPRADCGYPSSVELPDGSVVTAYYTQVSDDYHYEMRIARWNPSKFTLDGVPA
jgi:hypothetical protein